MPRVEIVGSFLPPEELENALNEKIHGNLSEEAYHAIEDKVIDSLIDREIESGLQIVTDGEMRRKSWARDFWEGFNGMSRDRIDTGSVYQDEVVRHDLLRFDGRIEFNAATSVSKILPYAGADKRPRRGAPDHSIAGRALHAHTSRFER